MSREKSVTDLLSSVGQRLRHVRKVQRLTQQAFAESLGLSQNYLSGVESGSQNLSKPVVLLIKHLYRINEAWLLTGDGPMYAEGQGSGAPVIDLDARSPAWKMHRQLDRIVTEGDRKKIEAIKGMLNAFDPGERSSEGVGEGKNEDAGPKSDLPDLDAGAILL